MPRSMLSRPKLGPIVRSSIGTIGAASEPARSNSARSCASNTERPLISKRFENTPLMRASLMTSSVADRRRRAPFAVALDHLRPVLDEQHGHRLADVVDGRVEHLARAGRVEPHVHDGLAVLVTRRGIDELVAGGDDVAPQQDRRAVLRA